MSRQSSSAKPIERAYELDGIRGWASLSVLLYHVFFEMIGHVVPGIENRVTYVLFNGEYAVLVFFILSGDALSTSFLSQRTITSIDRLVIKRYFRLTFPVFLSCLGVYLLMNAGWDWHHEAMRVLHNEAWFGPHLTFRPDLYHLFTYSFMGVYASNGVAVSFNPFLWTMSIEMVGSMLIFLYCYLWNRLNHPVRILCLLTLWLWMTDSFYFLFAIGMLFAQARCLGWVRQLRKSNLAQLISWCTMGVIIVFIDWSHDLHIVRSVLMGASAALVFSLYVNRTLIRLLTGRLSIYLGRLSFPLYLSHYWILISMMSFLTLSKNFLPQHPLRLIAIAILSSVVAIFVAHLFSTVERWYLRNMDRILNRATIRSSTN